MDTTIRYLTMLRMIPREPSWITVQDMRRKLVDHGYKVTLRTIQRDLIKLESYFPLRCSDNQNQFGWSWLKVAGVLNIPGLDPHTALTLKFVDLHLRRLLPPSVLKFLNPYLENADAVLEGASGPELSGWLDQIRVLSRGQRLQAPAIRDEVLAVIYDALLQGQRFYAHYRPRFGTGGTKGYEINPLGLVVRDQVIYLVCCLKEYDNVIQLVLHRFESAELLNTPRRTPPDFDLDAYIQSGAFDMIRGEWIPLTALIDGNVAFHLSESALAEDQVLEQQSDGRYRLTAMVRDTLQLRWWLLGFGEQVEVLEPVALREEFAERVRKLAERYQREG
ncbi:MAG: hypothetical protein QG599_3048 [Pseudomonadota bacterium]|nr:hypothetical protein [Pseudomonadota bacterium]